MSSLGIRLGLDRERQEQLLPILRNRLADWLRLSFRHDILVARAVRGLQIEAARSFDRLVLNPLLQLVVDRVPQAQLRTGDLARDLFPELVSLRAAVEDVVRQGVSAVQRLTENRVAEIARGEVRWAEASFRSVVGEEFGAGVAEAFGAGVEQKAATSLRDRVWLGDSTEKWFEKSLTTPTADAARAYITTGVKQGLTLDEMTKGIAGTRTQKGILARPKATAQALVRTAATHATSIAQVESFRALGITHWRFVATLDLRTSIQCASNDGQVYPLDEGPLPPLHPNCFPGDTPVASSGAISGVHKRWFDGEVCVIRTASGRVLTGTPNHPILTPRGWVALGLLAEGDDVVCDGSRQWGGSVDRDGENVHPRIHDVAEAFFASRDVAAMPVPVSAPDFHGDAADGDVALVGADLRLRPDLQPSFPQHRHQRALVGADLRGCRLRPAEQHLAGVPLAADSVVGGLGQSRTLFGSGAGHAGELLLGAVACAPSVEREDASDGPDVEPAAASADAAQADTVVEHPDDAVVIRDRRDVDRLACRAHLGAAGAKAGHDHLRSDAELARHLLDGGAGLVFTDKIQSVRRQKFAGHVFNLETTLGAYCAAGIVVHNCRSKPSPVINPNREPRGQRAALGGQVPASTTFEDWLGTQTQAEQNIVLGRAKAEAWRSGKLSLADMLGRDLQPLSLADLKELDRL